MHIETTSAPQDARERVKIERIVLLLDRIEGRLHQINHLKSYNAGDHWLLNQARNVLRDLIAERTGLR